MKNSVSTAALFDQLIQEQIAFAAWFNPREPYLGLVVGDASDVKIFDRFDRLNGEAGFVFAPFCIAESSPVILLKPKVWYCDFSDATLVSPEEFKSFENLPTTTNCPVVSKENYLQLIENTVANIREGALSKVIISRQIPVARNNASVGNTFLKLQDQTPNAFTYLVNLPVAGVWMGATPEVLIKSDGDRFETVSLAGTQVRKYDGEEYYWSTGFCVALYARCFFQLRHTQIQNYRARNFGKWKSCPPENIVFLSG
jgi:isochorismate synthase